MRTSLLTIPGWIAFLLSPIGVSAAELVKQGEILIPGKVVTGFNRYLGQPDIDLPGIGLGGFYTLGEYVPGAAEPLPLTPDTPDDVLLATRVDPGFFGLSGTDPSILDPAFVNVPLREVGTNLSLGDDERGPMPSSAAVDPLTNSQVAPAGPVTLGQWKRARGVVSLECHDDGTADLLIVARNLLPTRLYSLWGVVLDPAVGIRAVTFGGLPNLTVTSARGRATIRRRLSGCPLGPAADGSLLLALQLYFHSDQMSNGVHPSLPKAEGGLALGSIVHAHLEFNVSGQPLLAPEGWSDSPCLPGSTTHCLGDGRFAVEVTWTDFAGRTGVGHTTDFDSDVAGSFYFFNEGNEEILVKLFDGCGFNDHFWVFAAAATNVHYELTVTDTRTGASRSYSNPLGTRSPAITDTNAFATCP